MAVWCRQSAATAVRTRWAVTERRDMPYVLDFNTLPSHLLTDLHLPLPDDERRLAKRRRREELHRLVMSLINSMTPYERRYPLALHDESRRQRVASGAGAGFDAVKLALKCLAYHQSQLAMALPAGSRPLSYTAQMDPKLCITTHASLLLGTCPWCGAFVNTTESVLAKERKSSPPH